MDGDLGPYDVLDVRLRAADTIVFLDFSPVRCAWRAIRRSREHADFWRWLFTYRRLVSPGASRVDWDSYPDDPDFIVLADPDSDRFCIVDLAHEYT